MGLAVKRGGVPYTVNPRSSLEFAVALLLVVLPDWVLILRSAGLVLASGLLGYTLHSNPQWSLGIFVSPQARVYAPRLLGAAGCLMSPAVASIPR